MKFQHPKLFEEAVKAKTFPLYLILSEDEGFLEWGEGVVLKSLAGATVQRWDRLTKERLSQSLLQPSLFGGLEVFIAPLEEGETQLDLNLFTPIPGRHLILRGHKLLSQTKLYKRFDEKGVIFHLPSMKSWEKEKILIDWAVEAAKKEGKQLPSDVAKKLVEMQEGNFAFLQREWEKLVTYVGEQKGITSADLDKIVIRMPKEEVFSFVDALLKGDGKIAFKRLDDLLAVESSPIALLKLIRNAFQNVLQLHSLLAIGAPPEAIQKDLPYLQGRLLEQLVSAAGRTTLKKAQKTLYTIDRLETEYKNSSKGDALFLDYVVSTVMGVPALKGN